MAYDSKEDELSAYLLSNRVVFDRLCAVILEVGEHTQKSIDGNPILKHLTVLPLDMDGVTRTIKPFFINSAHVAIHYDWRDITIVGGSAFNAIEQSTQVDMDSHIATHTTDIDAVWWPTVIGDRYIPAAVHSAPVYPAVDPTGAIVMQHHYDSFMASSFDPKLRQQKEYGVTSVSPAIVSIANTYSHHLGRFLNKLIMDNAYFTGAIQKCLTDLGYPFDGNQIRFMAETTSLLPQLATDTPAEKTAKLKRVRGSIYSGSWSITGYLEILNLPMRLKLLDISIHDGCSSQKSTQLEEPRKDMLYCSTKIPNSLLHIPLPQVTPYPLTRLPIPSLEKLFKQQQYALVNRVNLYWGRRDAISEKKVQAHHRRLQYLLDFVKYVYGNSRNPVVQTFMDIFQLHKYPAFHHALFQKTLHETEEWMATCPLYLPAFPPCAETETDPEKVRQCAVQKCNIDPNNPVFQELCRNGKVIEASLCGVGSPKKATAKTRKRSRYTNSSKSRF